MYISETLAFYKKWERTLFTHTYETIIWIVHQTFFSGIVGHKNNEQEY